MEVALFRRAKDPRQPEIVVISGRRTLHGRGHHSCIDVDGIAAACTGDLRGSLHVNSLATRTCGGAPIPS